MGLWNPGGRFDSGTSLHVVLGGVNPMKSADKAFRQHGQRSGYAVASAVMNEHLIRTKRRRVWGAKLWYSPFLPGAGPTVAPVKVYAPDGTLKEVVSAEDWRRRHGNPFTQPEEDEGDATT